MTTELRPDLRTLPFGLKRYRPGIFEKLHACGSGIVTASQVPALFNESRFAGRFATLAHIKGLSPLESFGNEALMERGLRLEKVACEMVSEDKGWRVHQAKAWKAHDRIERLAASPDAVCWDNDDNPLGDHGNHPGIGEIKVVADMIWSQRWQEGPPLDVELQHQTQFACTGATWGFIAALVVGTFRWDLIVYETKPRADVIAILEAEVETALAKLDEGDLGAPDEHKASIRAAQRLWAPDESKVLALNDPEADDRLQRWLQARADRLAAEKVEEAQHVYFASRALDHGLIRCPGGGTVAIKSVQKKAHKVEATEYRRLTPKPAKEEP